MAILIKVSSLGALLPAQDSISTLGFSGWPQIANFKVIFYIYLRTLSPYGYNGVKIMFDPTVEVSESHTLYSSFGVLAQIGGSLGLYLGVSIIDSYKLINKIVPFISNIGSYLRKKI